MTQAPATRKRKRVKRKAPLPFTADDWSNINQALRIAIEDGSLEEFVSGDDYDMLAKKVEAALMAARRK